MIKESILEELNETAAHREQVKYQELKAAKTATRVNIAVADNDLEEAYRQLKILLGAVMVGRDHAKTAGMLGTVDRLSDLEQWAISLITKAELADSQD